MDHRGFSHPLFVIDLNGIVTHCDDQIRPIGECLHVCAPRPAYDADPAGMIFGQETLAVERGDKRNLLGLNELQQLSCHATARESKTGHEQGAMRFL